MDNHYKEKYLKYKKKYLNLKNNQIGGDWFSTSPKYNPTELDTKSDVTLISVTVNDYEKYKRYKFDKLDLFFDIYSKLSSQFYISTNLYICDDKNDNTNKDNYNLVSGIVSSSNNSSSFYKKFIYNGSKIELFYKINGGKELTYALNNKTIKNYTFVLSD